MRWAWKVKSLDIQNVTCVINKKARSVENFNDKLIMIFLNIVFQTSYEKCFIVERVYVWQSWFIYQRNITVFVWFYSEVLLLLLVYPKICVSLYI